MCRFGHHWYECEERAPLKVVGDNAGNADQGPADRCVSLPCCTGGCTVVAGAPPVVDRPAVGEHSDVMTVAVSSAAVNDDTSTFPWRYGCWGFFGCTLDCLLNAGFAAAACVAR